MTSRYCAGIQSLHASVFVLLAIFQQSEAEQMYPVHMCRRLVAIHVLELKRHVFGSSLEPSTNMQVVQIYLLESSGCHTEQYIIVCKELVGDECYFQRLGDYNQS